MRRLLAAALLLAPALALPSCGGTNPKVEEPLIRTFVRDLGRALWANDKDKVAAMVLTTAGQRGNPVGAKAADTPEGRAEIRDGIRRQLRLLLVDAGIMKQADLKGNPVPDESALNRLDSALRIAVDGKNALVRFDIAGSPTRAGEVVTFSLQKTPNGWRMYDYDREFVQKR